MAMILLLRMELILRMTLKDFVIMGSRYPEECTDGEGMEDPCFCGTPKLRLGSPMSPPTWPGMIGRNSGVSDVYKLYTIH